MLLDSSKLALLGLDPHILMLIGVAFMLVVMAVLLLARLRGRLRARLQTRAQGSSALEEQPLEQTPEELFAAAGAPLMSCTAEVLERRPLSEAQWDSPVPAAWTVFRLQIEEGAGFNLGLLLPVQHREAYSSGFLERQEGQSAEPILKAFSKALGGSVPGGAICGSSTGFLEFKTYVRNERPEVIPGNLDLTAADYWIFVKIFVQNTLELYVRVNAQRKLAEVAACRPAKGDELMRVLAATLRPELTSGGEVG